MDSDLAVVLIAIVGMAMTTIGVVIAMFVRLDRRIDRLDSKIDSVYHQLDPKIDGVYDKLDSKADSLTSNVVDLQQRFSRIERFLEARDGFTPAAGDSPASSATVE